MKWIIILAAISALVRARPEKYKEQEDFQFSRSSTDEGTKSGYYGAQRGNMGKNYERAHNMDTLAQHQMSGLVRQVEGELGDGVKTRTGSVFSAANSRGIYGSGRFDTSNLQGRNFQEGVSYDNSNLDSSLTHAMHSSSAHNSADYANRHSQSYSGYGRTTSDTQAQTEDLQSRDNLQTSNQHNYGSTRRSSGYQSQTGLQEQRSYDSDSTNSYSGYGSNVYTKLTPVRIVVTPGGRVALPVVAQTYDATHGSSVFNHNALDSELATTSAVNKGSYNEPNNPKYYEASYKYNKKWEKHDTIPTSVSVVIPTESTIPKNSELYEDVDVHSSGSQSNARENGYRSAHSSSASGRYDAAKSLSSQSGYNSNYNSQQYRGGSLNSNSNAFSQTGYKAQLDHGFSSDSSKAYTQAQRNSGSRHSDILTDSDLNTQARYNSGSQLDLNSQVEDLNTRPKSYHSSYSYHKSWERQGDPYVIRPASTANSDSDLSQRLTSSTTYQPSSQYNQRICEENCHIRVARSYGTDNQHMEQQSQSLHDGQDLGQQVQGTWKNLEGFGQLAQKSWDQQTDGQQSLNQWDNLKDLNQQSQSNWDQLNVGQQSQNQWDNLKDLNQQSQSTWDQQNVEQQSHNNWDNLKDLSQQSQNNWDQLNVEQQKSQTQGQNLENLSQQSQSNWDQLNVGQQTQNQENAFENLGQISQNNWGQQNISPQSDINWDKIETLDQQSHSNWDQQNVGQEPNNNWDNLENLNQQSLTKVEDVGQQSLNQNTWDKLENIRQDSQKIDNSDSFGQHARNFLEQQSQDIEYELSYKPQNDLYAQYAHKSEVIPKDKNLQHSKPVKEKELEKKIDILWNKFDSIDADKSKLDFSDIQNNTEFKAHVNDGMDQNTTTSYFDADILSQKESHSYKDNINDKIDIMPHQKESNDNSDYSYSSGFVNPFFNQYHKNQLSHYDSTYSESNGAFESNTWNSHVNSYSNSHFNLQKVNNSHTNIQDTPLTSLWSKFDKIETGLSTQMNHTDTFSTTNQTESNYTSIGAKRNSTLSLNQPWYIGNPQQTETSTVSESREYKGLLSDRITPKDLQPLNGELAIKPESSQDIGRGDIGPEEIMDIDESNKPYTNSTSAISQNTIDSPLKQDNVEQQIDQNNNTYKEKELPDDQLMVLSIQQQKNENKIVLSNKQYETNNTFQINSQQNKNENNKDYNTDLQNLKHNETSNSKVLNWLTQTDYFEVQTKTENISRHQNYDTSHQDHEVEQQISGNFEQENVYNFGQEDLQVFPQQNENVQNQYLHNFQEPLQDFGQHNDNLEQQNLNNFGQDQILDGTQKDKNIEQQNLYNFGPEEVLDATQKNKNIEQHNLYNFGREQVLDAIQRNKNIEHQNLYNFSQEQVQDDTQKNKNIEQDTFEPANKLDLEKQSRNHSQHNLYLHSEKNVYDTEKEIETLEQLNLKSKSNGTINTNNAETNLQFVNHQYKEVTQTNLPRVQKSVGSVKGESNQNMNEGNLLYVQQKVQDLGEPSEDAPLHHFEQNYATDYEPSLEQDFEQDFGQQHQAASGKLNNFEQESENIVDIQQNTRQNIVKNNPSTTTTSTQTTIISSQYAKAEKVTEKPGFWRFVGNKISNAKDKVVSWFRS